VLFILPPLIIPRYVLKTDKRASLALLRLKNVRWSIPNIRHVLRWTQAGTGRSINKNKSGKLNIGRCCSAAASTLNGEMKACRQDQSADADTLLNGNPTTRRWTILELGHFLHRPAFDSCMHALVLTVYTENVTYSFQSSVSFFAGAALPTGFIRSNLMAVYLCMYVCVQYLLVRLTCRPQQAKNSVYAIAC